MEDKNKLQKLADRYKLLLGIPEFNDFLKDIDIFLNDCTQKITTGCKSFDEYKYWLGRLHSTKEIQKAPEFIINKAKKELKERENNE